MNIYSPIDDTVILSVEVSDSSERVRELMSKDELNLNFSLVEYVDIPVGAYCSFGTPAVRYEVMSPASVKIHHTRNYEYNLVMESSQGRAKRYIVHDADGRVSFPLTAKARTHLELIIKNLNERENGEWSLTGDWSVGDCIGGSEKVISYNSTTCFDALTAIATEFDTEWEVLGTTIHLRKTEYNKATPLELSYDSGFKPNIERNNSEDLLSVQKLYVQGGEQNINASKYPNTTIHSSTLLLPRLLHFWFDGEYFKTSEHTETGYGQDGRVGVEMDTDSKGYALFLHGLSGSPAESGFDATEVYPKRVGEVSSVWYEWKGGAYSYDDLIDALEDEYGDISDVPDEVWAEQIFVDICDSSIPATLDYSAAELQINGEQKTVIFQSGQLTGKEFDITGFFKASKTIGSVTIPGNRFELKNATIDGYNMPSQGLHPSEDNTYAVFHCELPVAYLNSYNSTSGKYEGAEIEMLRLAAKYLYENSQPKYSYNGSLSGIWAKKNWATVGAKIRLGGYVKYTGTELNDSTPYLVRIKAIAERINDPYKPELTLDNKTVKGGVASSLRKAENEPIIADSKIAEERAYAKRSFRDAVDTSRLLIEAGLENFSGAINPIVVRTMQSIVGDESLQCGFFTARSCQVAILNPFSYDADTKTFSAVECVLKHYTIGIVDIKPSQSRSNEEYKRWNMTVLSGVALSDPDKSYYIYAKVDSANDGVSHLTGSFVLSESVIKMNDVEGYYHLLLGIINRESIDRNRSIATLYGYTEILPGQITTDIVKSSDGSTFFDLTRGILSLNNKSGISGTAETGKVLDKSIAAWFGGQRIDKENLLSGQSAANAAASLFRFDGTGYLAKGNITWDANGYGQVGGSGDNFAVKWDANRVRLGNGVYIGSDSDKTLGSILTLLNKFDSWFEENTETHTLILKKDGDNPRNFAAYGNVAAGGVGEGGGGGGAKFLYQLEDIYNNGPIILRADGTARQNGDALAYDSAQNKWVASPIQSGASSFAQLTGSPYDNTNLATALNGKVDNSAISDMATKTWVNGQGYLTGITSTMVTTALGYTPYNAANIGSASVAYATSAGNADTLDGQHGSYYASASSLGNYLPLSGGAMTGPFSGWSHYTSYTADGLFGSTASPSSILIVGSQSFIKFGYLDYGSGNYCPRIGFQSGIFGTITKFSIGLAVNYGDKFIIGRNNVSHDFVIDASGNVSLGGNLSFGSASVATNADLEVVTIEGQRYLHTHLPFFSDDEISAGGIGGEGGEVVTSFNGRSGGVTLTNNDVTTALGSNWSCSTLTANGTIKVIEPSNSRYCTIGAQNITYKFAPEGWAGGIGFQSPYDTTEMFCYSALYLPGGFQFGYIGGTYEDPWIKITSPGNIIAKGSITPGSDMRWKHSITPVFNGIDAIMKLQPSEWVWNSDNYKGSGLIAQQVQPILPHLIVESGGYLHLNYDGLHAYEISAIQSHETRIQQLERENAELKMEIQRLRS